jgi:hypothetical protein
MGETPGMRLGGSDAIAPASFEFVQQAEVIQLAVPGTLFPRVVNIWGVGFEDALYVWSDPDSGWSTRVDARPDRVRIRVGGSVYAVRATEVRNAREKERVVAAYQAKYAESLLEMYGRATTVDDFELLYRLTPR